MKKLYLKNFKEDISNLAQIELDDSFVVDIEQTDEKKVLIVKQEEKEVVYKMVDELPKEKGKVISIGGFVEKASKPDKKSKVKSNDNNLMASLYGYAPVMRELPKRHKVIGYIRVKDSDTYIAIIKRKIMLLPILLPLLIGILIIAILAIPETKTPISLDQFIQGEVGQGEIEIEKAEMAKSENIRIIMNANPTLVDGKMNLLLYNHEESNVLSMVAEVMLISEVDYDGNIIEKYDEQIKIAETPLLNPGDNLEYVEIFEDAEVDPGKYDGRVLFTAYSITEEGAMPIGQVSGRINLVVK